MSTSPPPLLLNAARAFVMVGYADGVIALSEQLRFTSSVHAEPVLKDASREDITAAWEQAVKEVQASKSFGGPLVAIRQEITSDADKAVLMRIAQTAVVADTTIELQENLALRYLAEALGVDPDNY